MRNLAFASCVRRTIAYATEYVKQVFNERERIDELVHDPRKRVLQRVVVDRGEIKVYWCVTKVTVVKFVQHALLNVPEVFLCVVRMHL